MEDIILSDEVKQIIHLIQHTRKNLFITGKAGTGKSTLLKYITGTIAPEIIVTAPTGIAAINVNGETIHSFFKLKPGYELDEASHVRIDKRMIANYATVQTIIIDEISMVRADILDAIDVFLRRVKNNTDHFGGVRMIFFGDLYQLPPVLKRENENTFLSRYASPYFFSAHVFKQKDLFSTPFELTSCELTKIYRQKGKEFTTILNAIRTKTINDDQLKTLNRQFDRDPENRDQLCIQLVATNAQANYLNQQKLDALNHPEITFNAVQHGKIEYLYPTDLVIKVKIGAQVIFINNDSEKRWVNGSLGEIIGQKEAFDEIASVTYQLLEVKLENGKKVEVTPHTWPISKYRFKGNRFVREEIGSFTQIPIKLAWAITIHKSQGKTFNAVRIDLGKQSFAHGQTYVALSRCRTLENIKLARPIKISDIIIDDRVLAYDQ